MIELPWYTRSTEVRTILGDCPLRWYLDHTVTKEQHFTWFTLGTEIHAAIERMSLSGKFNVVEQINDTKIEIEHDLQIAEADGQRLVWARNRPNMAALHEAVETCLANWQDLVEMTCVELEYIEVPLALLDEDLQSVSTPDLVTRDFRIVDYKTGQGSENDSFQLWFYHWLGRKTELIPKDTPFRGEFWHLTHRQIQAAEPYPGDTVIETMVRSTLMHKREQLFFPRPSWYCKVCPHQKVCPTQGGVELDKLLDQEVQWVPLSIGKEEDEKGRSDSGTG